VAVHALSTIFLIFFNDLLLRKMSAAEKMDTGLQIENNQFSLTLRKLKFDSPSDLNKRGGCGSLIVLYFENDFPLSIIVVFF
jgi:hypothetical protein